MYLWWLDSPALVKRMHYRLALFLLVLLVILLAMWFLDVRDVVGTTLWSVSLFLIVTAFAASMFLAFLWIRRLVERLDATNYKLCPKCGYQLTGRMGQVTCPECGAPCDMLEVQSVWREFRRSVVI